RVAYDRSNLGRMNKKERLLEISDPDKRRWGIVNKARSAIRIGRDTCCSHCPFATASPQTRTTPGGTDRSLYVEESFF
ncbi:MAG TPA: hypothetical protein PK648_17355, partial [Verrucomicrobiales bacterium]|nr:hypothetical protein [Verrucomicrobiales bacterium]